MKFALRMKTTITHENDGNPSKLIEYSPIHLLLNEMGRSLRSDD